MRGRVPDVIVIGAMKAGTTTLFRWLDSHPGCQLSPVKEPHFFSRQEAGPQALADYLGLFADVPEDLVTGEASASYADPRIARQVAGRIAEVTPAVRLVYLVRDPVERMRSHYLHEWQRSRERRPFAEAIAAADNPYVALSRYADTAEQFREVFGDALLVVPTDDLAGAEGRGWRTVTDHLGLDPHPAPDVRSNVTTGKSAFTPWMLRLWESGWLDRARRMPRPVRRLALRATSGATRALHEQSAAVERAPVPGELEEELRAQLALLLGRTS